MSMHQINSQLELIGYILDKFALESQHGSSNLDLSLDSLEILDDIDFNVISETIKHTITNNTSYYSKERKTFINHRKIVLDFNLENVIFHKKVTFSSLFSENIKIIDIKFMDDVKFEGHNYNDLHILKSVFEKKCLFEKINVMGQFQFLRVDFKDKVIVTQCVFHKGASFTIVDFYNRVQILVSEFKDLALFEIVSFIESTEYQHSFYDTKCQEITFWNSYIRNISFNHSDFQELGVYPIEKLENQDVCSATHPTEFINTDFKHCKFNRLLLGNSIIKNCIFDSLTIIEEADFHKKINIYLYKNEITTIIDSTNFINIDFQKEGDFKFVDFKNTVRFERCRFVNRGAFRNCTFDDLQFDNLRLEDSSYIYFGYTTGKLLQFINTILLGRVDFNDDSIDILDLFGTVIRGVLNRIKFTEFNCANYQTATILKNEALKQNNLIRAIEYQAEEKTLYMSTLSWKKDFKECLILFISKLVNNHGLDWIRAMAFTVWSWIFFYTIFITPIDFFWGIVAFMGMITYLTHKYKWTIYIWYSLTLAVVISVNVGFNISFNSSTYLSGLSAYFNPTNYTELIDIYAKSDTNVLLKICGIAVFMIGKVAIIFGGYEIIKAFRKYK